MLSESPGYWQQLKPILESGKIAGAKVHEARVAALCLTNGVRESRSADRDFGRFTSSLSVRNPLVG